MVPLNTDNMSLLKGLSHEIDSKILKKGGFDDFIVQNVCLLRLMPVSDGLIRLAAFTTANHKCSIIVH
jgi:hypothetical protein